MKNYPVCHELNTYRYGGALALWLERRTPDRETRVRSSAGSVCCFLKQETFTPQKVLVIPRNRWLRLNMTEILFTGTLNHNQNKKQKLTVTYSKITESRNDVLVNYVTPGSAGPLEISTIVLCSLHTAISRKIDVIWFHVLLWGQSVPSQAF